MLFVLRFCAASGLAPLLLFLFVYDLIMFRGAAVSTLSARCGIRLGLMYSCLWSGHTTAQQVATGIQCDRRLARGMWYGCHSEQWRQILVSILHIFAVSGFARSLCLIELSHPKLCNDISGTVSGTNSCLSSMLLFLGTSFGRLYPIGSSRICHVWLDNIRSIMYVFNIVLPQKCGSCVSLMFTHHLVNSCIIMARYIVVSCICFTKPYYHKTCGSCISLSCHVWLDKSVYHVFLLKQKQSYCLTKCGSCISRVCHVWLASRRSTMYFHKTVLPQQVWYLHFAYVSRISW